MLGVDLGARARPAARAILLALEGAVTRAMALVPAPEVWPTRVNRRIAGALTELDELAHDIIAERRRSSGGRDLLAQLLEAQDPGSGRKMSERELRDEVMTMLVSGSVTTANALTWAWYLLAKHPRAAAEVRREAAEVLNDAAPGAVQLDGLAFTRAVAQETLRLFPPTWRLARASIEPDRMGEHMIPAGATVVFSPYVLQHHAAFWDDPERFWPERFLSGGASLRPRFAYIPFGGGPRACIGSQLATAEMQVVLSMVAKRFRLRLLPGHAVDIEALNTLRPRCGLPMAVTPI
jgi:cytochrome P450